MLLREAEWLAQYFAGRTNAELGSILNIGSSTADFRERVQPFVEQLIFRPLTERGVPVIHTDIKADAGISVVADILDESDLARLAGLGAKTILCSNVLEHVPDKQAFADRLAGITPKGGTLVVTVPSSYPYHPDPIDNMFRPDTEQLKGMFADLELHISRVVTGPTLMQEFAAKPSLLLRRLARTFVPLPRMGGWLSTIHRWGWLFRPYAAICAVFIRP
jgi:hypothetical protein